MKPNAILQQLQQQFRVGANWANNPVANAIRVAKRRLQTWWQSWELGGDARQRDSQQNSQQNSQHRSTQTAEPQPEVREKLNFERDFEEVRRERRIEVNETRYEFKESIYRKPERYITDDSRYCIQEIQSPPLKAEKLKALRNGIKVQAEKALNFRVVLPVDLGFETMTGFDEQNNRLYCIYLNRLTNPLSWGDSISSRRVYHILQDVLQSLEYLHLDCHLLSNSSGIAHGDLKPENLSADKFGKIYLHNLKLFNFQFQVDRFEKSSEKEKDLESLGFYVNRYLIDGNQHLIIDSLQRFVEDLQNGTYKKVDRAIDELNRIQSSEGNLFREPSTTEPNPDRQNRLNSKRLIGTILKFAILVLLGLLLFFLLGFLKNALFPPRSPQLSTQNCIEAKNCKIATVFENNPNLDATLTYHSGEIWRQIWTEENRVQHRSTLEEIFRERGMKFGLTFEENPSRSQIAIGPEIEPQPEDWTQEAIAYDGFVVFVSNQETEEGQRLANLLRGRISLSDLRQIYNGRLRYWSEVNGVRRLRTLTEEIQVYFADEESELEEQFKKLLYADPNESLRWDIPEYSSTMETIGAVADPNHYAIGVARLGKVFEQCSVYPLAIISESGDVIQPFIDESERPIDSATDLCMDKGSYFPDRKQFASGRYPLGYQWMATYPEGGNSENARRFIEMLKTQEGQTLLQEAGLILLPPSER